MKKMHIVLATMIFFLCFPGCDEGEKTDSVKSLNTGETPEGCVTWTDLIHSQVRLWKVLSVDLDSIVLNNDKLLYCHSVVLEDIYIKESEYHARFSDIFNLTIPQLDLVIDQKQYSRLREAYYADFFPTVSVVANITGYSRPRFSVELDVNESDPYSSELYISGNVSPVLEGVLVEAIVEGK